LQKLKQRFRRMVRLGYPLAILISLLGNRTWHMSYQFEAAPHLPGGLPETQSGQTSFILAALCNGQYYGDGFNPAPDASQTDGLLDICLVDPLSLISIIPLIPRYKKGTHQTHPAVHTFKTTGGHLEAPAGQLLLGNYDGELFEAPAIDFKILPGALRFAFY
jgi:diacylglycerol kinase (ATP)